MALSNMSVSRDSAFESYKGQKLSKVPTPHLIIDRSVFVSNCHTMAESVSKLGWTFRAHIKTHKCAPGAQLQCEKTKTGRIIASTVPEMRTVLDHGYVSSGLVKDMLYSMPFYANVFEPLSQVKAEMEKHGATLRLMIDHPTQITTLQQLLKAQGRSSEVWSIFLKLDVGTHRAGLPLESQAMTDLIHTALDSPNVRIFGTYAHAGHSYSAKSPMSAAEFLALEVSSVNAAARIVLDLASKHSSPANELGNNGKLVLAVGATPTAHASKSDAEWKAAQEKAGITADKLCGSVELHAGNYCLLDMQQYATGCIGLPECAMTVGASVVSTYPHRNEALCDAGAIAMSKDVGPIPGYGWVVQGQGQQRRHRGWTLGRTSQEHGILTHSKVTRPESPAAEGLEIGDYVQVIPQHACLTAAQHFFFFVTDDGETVADVWEPVKGW